MSLGHFRQNEDALDKKSFLTLFFYNYNNFCFFYNCDRVFINGEDIMKDIKTLAAQAKNRLRGICSQSETKGNLRLIKSTSSQIRVIITEDDQEKIYEKYKDVVMNEELHNPIAYMMDKKIYNQLCDNKKEKYFFETLEKYQKLRERCCKEQMQHCCKEQDNLKSIVG